MAQETPSEQPNPESRGAAEAADLQRWSEQLGWSAETPREGLSRAKFDDAVAKGAQEELVRKRVDAAFTEIARATREESGDSAIGDEDAAVQAATLDGQLAEDVARWYKTDHDVMRHQYDKLREQLESESPTDILSNQMIANLERNIAQKRTSNSMISAHDLVPRVVAETIPVLFEKLGLDDPTAELNEVHKSRFGRIKHDNRVVSRELVYQGTPVVVEAHKLWQPYEKHYLYIVTGGLAEEPTPS